MKWHYLQHVPFEGPGYLDSWARNRGFGIGGTELWREKLFPALGEFDGLFVLGGPMNVYEDRYPWLAAEKAFVGEVIAAGKPILAVCLGAQLLSVVLGGSVVENSCKEIGWFPVALTREAQEATLFKEFPDRFQAFHWHGDRFTVPPAAVHLASSEACAEQAFIHEDRIVGLQFHLESTEENIAALIRHCGDEINCAPYVQAPCTIEESLWLLPKTHSLLDALLDALVHEL